MDPDPRWVWSSRLGEVWIAGQVDFEESFVPDDPPSFLPGIPRRRDERRRDADPCIVQDRSGQGRIDGVNLACRGGESEKISGPLPNLMTVKHRTSNPLRSKVFGQQPGKDRLPASWDPGEPHGERLHLAHILRKRSSADEFNCAPWGGPEMGSGRRNPGLAHPPTHNGRRRRPDPMLGFHLSRTHERQWWRRGDLHPGSGAAHEGVYARRPDLDRPISPAVDVFSDLSLTGRKRPIRRCFSVPR